MSGSKAILEARGLGKLYRREQAHHADHGVRDLMRRVFLRPPRRRLEGDEFWAVRGVDVELRPGDSLGVVGVNGSGKTTMLKMVAGLIRPDEGSFRVDGHVQAVFNLQSGFKPQLSGRENVIHAASLRGFKRAATNEVIDTIIEFSELEDFIEAPVRTYSAGMRARLGFSICSHLDPSVVVVDEALTVGDQAFRNKCNRRMQELREGGVTMIFVSHSMGQVREFCDHALWLDKGHVMASGDVRHVTDAYVSWLDKREVEKEKEKQERKEREKEQQRASASASPALKASKENGARAAHPLFGFVCEDTESVRGVSVKFNGEQDWDACLQAGQPLAIDYEFELLRDVEALIVNLQIFRADGLKMARLSSVDDGGSAQATDLAPGPVHGRLEIYDLNLAPGEYRAMLAIKIRNYFLFREGVGGFRVMQGDELINGLVTFRRRHTLEVNGRTVSAQA